MRIFLKFLWVIVSFCNVAFAGWFVEKWDKDTPPTLEQSIQALLKVNCYDVKRFRGLSVDTYYKNEKASQQCLQEQKFLRAIFENDVKTYRQMFRDNEDTRYFLFYTTFTPRFAITPLMVAIVSDASDVFKEILKESGKVDFLSKSVPRYNINKEMYDNHPALGGFSLNDRIYDVNCIKALDLAAMYHRYDMFSALLDKGAEYNSPKCPQNNGIITFGDYNIFELMVGFDPHFLEDFAGGHILHYAAKENNAALVEYLIKEKKMPIDLLKAGETSLDAALNGKNFHHRVSIEAAQKLIELGAKVSEGNQRRIQKLIEKGQWQVADVTPEILSPNPEDEAFPTESPNVE